MGKKVVKVFFACDQKTFVQSAHIAGGVDQISVSNARHADCCKVMEQAGVFKQFKAPHIVRDAEPFLFDAEIDQFPFIQQSLDGVLDS